MRGLYVWTAVKLLAKAVLCSLGFMAVGAALVVGSAIISGCA